MTRKVLLFFFSFNSFYPRTNNSSARNRANILYMVKTCPSKSKGKKSARSGHEEEAYTSERKVALFFVLAVAGREIVLHARIASKRRRLHRGIKKKKQNGEKRKKTETARRKRDARMGTSLEEHGERSVEGWCGRRRGRWGTSGGQGELPKTN